MMKNLVGRHRYLWRILRHCLAFFFQIHQERATGTNHRILGETRITNYVSSVLAWSQSLDFYPDMATSMFVSMLTTPASLSTFFLFLIRQCTHFVPASDLYENPWHVFIIITCKREVYIESVWSSWCLQTSEMCCRFDCESVGKFVIFRIEK